MAKKTDEADEETEATPTSSGTSIAHRALFSALENSLDGDDEDEDEKKESNVSYSCKPINRLFHPSARSGTLVLGHSQKQQQQLLLETIQGFNKGHARRFFQGLKTLVETITTSEAYVPESAFHADGEEHDENVVPSTEITPDKESTEVLHFLQYVTMCIDAYLQGQIERSQKAKRASRAPSLSMLAEVYGVALDLHNLLFSLQACGPEGLVTQNAILGLCESWWHANASQRENMILQCLPLLVLQALDGKNFQKSHIKRIFRLKEAFHIIDFTNPSSNSLRSLLLRLTSNPLCLRMPEGISFLASLFQEPSLVTDLHLAVRAQIPEAKDTVLKAYGEIYLKAWKDSADVSEECREAIENEALQNFVHAVIHMASSATAKSILKLLEPFHSKKTPDVEGLLYRLYSPIIWRSLGSANSQVRVNAIVALGQVFPLQEASRTQTQAAIAKGTEALKNALQDSDHRVRVAGSETTAKICVMFWDVLPAADIRMLLNHIVMEHASDATSSDVRAGALDAITTLLESPQSRAVLRPLLPSLGNLIHDKAQRVRLAAIRMLMEVKRIPGIRFYHVVPVDHLLARLSEEGRIHRSPCNGVAKELTALLLNSYFPQGPKVTGTDQLKRTLTFLLTQPGAASVFYSNLASHLPVESVAKLIVMLLKCLNSAVKADQAKQIKQSKIRKKRRRHGADDDEDAETDDQTLTAANTPLMADLAETIFTLWESIASQLRTTKHQDCNDLLSQSLSEVELTHVLVHFEQKATENASKNDETSSVCDDCFRTCTAILRCAGQLSLEAVDGILPHITASLSSLSDNEGSHVDGLQQNNVSAHIALLCMWGMTDEVVNSLSASIESGSEDVVIMASPIMFGEHASTAKTRKSSRSGGRSSRGERASSKMVVPTMPPRIAWGVIQDILRGADPSNVETRKSILSSPRATKVMEAAFERGISVAEHMLLTDSGLGRSFRGSEIEFVLHACEAYGRFALHKAANDNDSIGFSRQAALLLDWTTDKIIPALKGSQHGENELRNIDLSCILNTSDSILFSASPGVTSPPRQRANLNRTPDRLHSGLMCDVDDSMLNEPSVFLVSAIAASLLQSSCTIFSEWLAVGGGGATNIVESAIKWCSIFEVDGNEEVAIETQKELFPGFARLALYLCKHSYNFLLLKELLVKCNEVVADAKVMGKALSALLSARNAQRDKLLEGIVDAVLEAAYSFLDRGTDTLIEFPTCVGELWSNENGSIGLALSGLMSIPQASTELIRNLVSRLGADTGIHRISNFQAKLLWLLVENAEDVETLKETIGGLSVDHLEGVCRNVVNKVLDTISS